MGFFSTLGGLLRKAEKVDEAYNRARNLRAVVLPIERRVQMARTAGQGLNMSASEVAVLGEVFEIVRLVADKAKQ